MPAEHLPAKTAAEQRVQSRIEGCLREVSDFLDALELIGRAQRHTLRDRFENLGPARTRKLHKTIGFEWMWLTSWPEVKTVAAETALRDAMRSHWARLGAASQDARMRFNADPATDGALKEAADVKVKTIWFRGYFQSSEEGRRALATVATLFDGLLPDAEETRRIRAQGAAAQRAPTETDARPTAPPPPVTAPSRTGADRTRKLDTAPWRLLSFDEALALRAAKIRHPVSPAYSVLLAISQRIDSRRGQRLTHGERLLITLFDELNAEWENGGLEQYLTNSAGAGADHARAYLGEIGAWGTLAILDEAAWRFYDGSIPRDSAARDSRIEEVLTSDDDANVWLDNADRRWRTAQKELYERLVDYAADHPDDFARPTTREIRSGALG